MINMLHLDPVSMQGIVTATADAIDQLNTVNNNVYAQGEATATAMVSDAGKTITTRAFNWFEDYDKIIKALIQLNDEAGGMAKLLTQGNANAADEASSGAR
jgi:hypothetical protein